MYIYIGIEDLVANALIESIESTGKREVTFDDLDRYGATVIQLLNEKEKQAILLLSKVRTDQFLRDYSEYFELFENNSEEGIRVKNGITIKDLWRGFRGDLSLNVMKAFTAEQSVAALISQS